MLIGVPRELLDNESRVAATPKTVQQILKLGFDVIVEHDAGFKASFEDQAFVAAGAKVGDAAQVWQADIIFKVNAPTDDEIALIKEGATLVSFIWPAQNPQLMEKLSAKKINVLAMEQSRASADRIYGATQASVEGASGCDAKAVNSRSAEFLVSGASRVSFGLVDSLSYSVSGASKLSYLGKPFIASQTCTGASTVKAQ